jgi:hypothetical protein
MARKRRRPTRNRDRYRRGEAAMDRARAEALRRRDATVVQLPEDNVSAEGQDVSERPPERQA